MENNNISQFEAKAYKRLYELYRGTLLRIIHNARNSVEYLKNKPDEMTNMMACIADEKRWDSCGIESNTDTKIIDELEKCLE